MNKLLKNLDWEQLSGWCFAITIFALSFTHINPEGYWDLFTLTLIPFTIWALPSVVQNVITIKKFFSRG